MTGIVGRSGWERQGQASWGARAGRDNDRHRGALGLGETRACIVGRLGWERREQASWGAWAGRDENRRRGVGKLCVLRDRGDKGWHLRLSDSGCEEKGGHRGFVGRPGQWETTQGGNRETL